LVAAPPSDKKDNFVYFWYNINGQLAPIPMIHSSASLQELSSWSIRKRSQVSSSRII
jgi:hypothetical protein